MDSRRPKHHRFHCLMFCLKDQVKMDRRQCGGDFQTENTESRLELTRKWFTENQTPLILQNRCCSERFPVISRKDAEEHLKDKKLGCFLIRLSEKSTGCILSYKGHERCRHFVINQNNEGRFIVTGDTEMHDTLTSLTEYYKTSPIQPFGEYLTSSCFESCTSELYDVIHADLKEKAAVSVKAVRGVWDHQCSRKEKIQQRPALPPKSHRNTQYASHAPLKTTSMEVKASQENVLYSPVNPQKPRERARTPAVGRNISLTDFRVSQGREPKGSRLQKGLTTAEGTVYSELMVHNSRSQSLPLLDDDVEEDVSCRRRSQPQLSSHLQFKSPPTNGLPGFSSSLDKLWINASLYQLAGSPGQRRSKVDVQKNEVIYAKVPHKRVPGHSENTYEKIPDSRSTARATQNSTHTETFEMLTDPKPKLICSARAVTAEKWKWLSTEKYRKK